VIKVSQSVSGELVLERLIERLMRAAIENAGAQRGLLIGPQNDEMRIEAEATTRGENLTVNLGVDANAAPALPESVIKYVMRTQETVILDNALSNNLFSADPYIAERRARSVLCLPLNTQGKLIGILYLENNLTPHVFNADRVTVLKVLASQAAISLENTRLYRDLAEREAKIRRLVDANIIGIFIWDYDGRILEANDAFLRMVGYDREDLVSGRVWWTDLTPPDWRQRNDLRIETHKSSGRFPPFEKEYTRKDGTRVPVLIGEATFEEGGNQGVAYVLDLTERKRAQESEELAKLNEQLEKRVADQVGEIERMSRLRRFLPPQVADLIVASGTEKQLESHRREITALFCDLRGFTGFSESADPEDVMTLLREYHEAIGDSIIKYSGTLERYAGDGVMVVFNDPVPVENPALQAVLMALEMRDAIGALTETWRRWGHEIGFGIGIAHGFATLGTIGFEGRFDYAAIGTVSNVASRLCDEAKPGQILISPRVLTKVENAVKVEPVGEFELKGIRRPLAAYNVLAAVSD
jgi:PAS domain S-box-containing protein